MKKTKICLMSLLYAVLSGIYVFLVSLLMQNGEKIFGTMTNFSGPFFVLLLLTFSVALMGILIFGKPVKLYLDGDKKEAVKFLLATLGWLLLILILVGIALIIF